ncbi:hypothetical protein FXO38_11716 [Capsicum annuum]|nr:hypothetical protein FXO37_18010 [Capsicum annuum]KAF3661388.1 hypothetical protein FXO38_11716 [Capsicum annuum]
MTDEEKERDVMKLLLKLKNGNPVQSEKAAKNLIDSATGFGVGPFFNRILPLLMEPTLEQAVVTQLLIAIQKVMSKLGESVCP